MTSRLARIACCALALGLAGCEAAKSSNPTSPTVAGPIPGVNITAPALIEPAQGFKFKESEQPIRLIVQNATSSGVRPLTYTFEVAADSSFTTKVFGRSGVAPGDGRTSVQIDRLEIGRAYYWRAWAADGANTGATATAGFEIYPKPAVTAPAAFSPINNEVVGSSTPTLKAHNATWVGPVGGLTYEFQVATDQSFSKLVAAGIINEGAGDTTFNSSPLSAATSHFWRVRATDGENSSGWSVTQGFRTPAAPAPPSPSPSPGNPVPPGSCASNNGPAIVACIGARYPDRLRPVGSLGERQTNMAFIRDRIIEAGKCGGLDLGQNLKRGGPELSIDFLAWRRGDGDMGIDIGFDYDNISTPLRLTWGEAGLGASYKSYPSVPCGGV
jgi:hypothetical protein